MESIISTFHIDWKIIIAQAVNFGVVLLVLYWYALKPLSKLMEERKERITKGLADARESDEMLKKVAQEYEQNTIKLRQVSIEAKKELNRELEELRAQNIEKIKKDNDDWMKKRAQQMEVDKKTMVESVKGDIVNLAMQAAEKIIKEKGEIKNV